MRHFRIALRTLARRPGFALIAIVTLALGIGATAAIFSVVNAVVLQPLDYPEPDELVRIEHPVPALNPEWRWRLSEAGWFAMRESSGSFEDIAVYNETELTLSGDGVAERVSTAMVSANLFEVLGAGPAQGRLLRWEDNEPGRAPVAVLSHEFWRTRLGGEPGAVGSTLFVEGRPVEVVGVLEPGFDLPNGGTSLWLPVAVSPTNQPVNWHRFESVGRLKEGVSGDAALADLRRLVASFPERLPQAYGSGFMERSAFDVDVVPLREYVLNDADTALWVLLGAVGMVLLIGCANVANLFIVRIEAGRREYAVRTALGASWWDIARKSLAESALLAGAAAALALLLATWGLGALLRLAPDLPRAHTIGVGSESVLFTVVVAGVAALVFGLLPAVRGRVSMDTLREGTGLTPSRKRHALRAGLVVGEMALALVLLAGAGLMIRTFQNIRAVDPGVDPGGVLTAQVSLPSATYRGYDDVAVFYRDLLERVEALPGVVAAGATQELPLVGEAGCSLVFVEDPAARERVDDCFASTIQVTPGYFRAMGIAVDGDAPGWSDQMERRGQVVVSRPLAERVWPDGPVLGQGIKGNGGDPPYYRVAGVAGAVRGSGLTRPPVDRIYFPMLPMEGAPLWSPPRGMTLVVRTSSSDPATLAGPIRRVIADMDPTVAVGGVRPMTEVVADSMGETQFVMLLLAIAAAVALALGVIGLYGVISYVVEERRTEIGIRMALGARAGEVKAMVVKQAAWLAGGGTLLGGLIAMLSSRALATQLYDVEATDPVTLIATAGLLVAVALAAAYLPASRAASVEPMGVLRGDR